MTTDKKRLQVLKVDDIVNKAQYELLVLNEMLEREIEISCAKRYPQKQISALRCAHSTIDAVLSGFSGVPSLRADLVDGGF